MMPAGRPPTPTKLKILRGNPGKHPLPKGEPQPRVEAPPRPAWIVGAARAEWESIVPELVRLGLLTRVDKMALAGYCQASAELEEATRILNRDGRLIETPALSRSGEPVQVTKKGKLVLVMILKVHPMIRVQRDAFARVRAFLTEFGLSPSTRTRVKSVNEDAKADPFEAFLGGAKAKKRG
jgi:P27 family predicted phage terminase small subunit